MSARTVAAPAARIPHEPDHGFCSVCGAVWPCWRAGKVLLSRPVKTAA